MNIYQPDVPKMPSIAINHGEMPESIKKAYEVFKVLNGLTRSQALYTLRKCEAIVNHYTDATITPLDTESEGWWYPFG